MASQVVEQKKEIPKDLTPTVRPKTKTELIDEKMRPLYEEESRLVRGKFICFEPRGGSATFTYKKYKWDVPKTWTMFDGAEYEVPLGLARHLNGIDITATAINGKLNTCAYPIHDYQIDRISGKSVPQVGKYVRRYAFQSMEFGT